MEYALIVAGGKGLRMGGELPKQFLPIGGKTCFDAYFGSLLCLQSGDTYNISAPA